MYYSLYWLHWCNAKSVRKNHIQLPKVRFLGPDVTTSDGELERDGGLAYVRIRKRQSLIDRESEIRKDREFKVRINRGLRR